MLLERKVGDAEEVGDGVEGFCGGVGMHVCVSSVAFAGRGFVGGRRIEREEYSRNIYLERLGGFVAGYLELVFED